MKTMLFFLLFWLPLCLPAKSRQVVLTIDDLPSQEVALSTEAELTMRNNRIVRALKNTRAIGFVNEDKLRRDGKLIESRRDMLKHWLQRGLDLGNHTFNHNGMHATPIDVYEQSILAGEKELRPLMAEFERKPQWFRHPYLQAGQNEPDRQRLAEFLARHQYQVAPVTIDNGEWIYARAYLNLLKQKNPRSAKQLRREYVDYIDAKFAFYEQASVDIFDREIPQILLLHANALNADALPALLKRVKRRGYEFISIKTAMSDPAFQHADGYRGRAGISWLHRWAMADKKPAGFYRGEPIVPKHVLEWAGVDGE